ncbi:MAG: hypothetical protein NW217_11850 [Hyphomicrobiaceae bacterium]|nr:hypothetical protein [Hyphomicrobiaceae bacterium]
MIDNLFLLAMASLGWGLSLATYRLFARRFAWPMGALHADLPVIPILIGLVAVLAGVMFAAARGAENGGWIMIGFGFLLALFWTGFLRVGSQVSLFLAPLAAFMLVVGWFSVPLGFGIEGWATKTPGELLERAAPGVERDVERAPYAR